MKTKFANITSKSIKQSIWLPRSNGPYPLLIWNHGSKGNLLSEKKPHTIKCLDMINTFLDMGIAVFAPSRRGYDGQKGLPLEKALAHFIADPDNCDNFLVKRLHKEYREIYSYSSLLKSYDLIDPTRICFGGCSIGGILTLMIARHIELCNLVIVFSPGAIMWQGYPLVRNMIIDHASKINMPILLIQTENDYDLSPAIELEKIFANNKIEHKILIYPSHGTSKEQAHGFYNSGCKQWMLETQQFLQHYKIL